MAALRFAWCLAALTALSFTPVRSQAPGPAAPAAARSDLDDFMAQVLARRDDSWKRLQQYILDERERVELRGPSRTTLWGEERDYTWFIREGLFIRSPLAVNGAKVGEADRQKYEADYLRRERRRDERARSGAADPSAADTSDQPPTDVNSLIRQTQQPQFISSSYFLRFKFDQGRYALVGKEPFAGKEVLRVEYYPTQLFSEDARRERERQQGRRSVGRRERQRDLAEEEQVRRLLNKASKVTLWIEPESKQILQYVFDDLGWDFLPGQWLVRVNDVTASMTLGEAFPGIWLPRNLKVEIELFMAAGPVNLDYSVFYHDYRQPEIGGRIAVPGGR